MNTLLDQKPIAHSVKMDKLNILMLSPVPVQPANVGDRVRVLGLAMGLAKHHNITLIAPSAIPSCSQSKKSVTKKFSYTPVPIKEAGYSKKILSLISKWPYHTALRYQPEIHKMVKKKLADNKFDLIYCHFLQTLPYTQESNIPIFLDQHNVDFVYWERQVQQYKNSILKWLARRNLQKTIEYEHSNFSRITGVVSVSEEDSNMTKSYANKEIHNFLVAKNGVDLSEYTVSTKQKYTDRIVLGFLGSMNLSYNEQAATYLIDKILPLVKNNLPDIELSVLVIGKNPTKKLMKIAASSENDIELNQWLQAYPL